MLAASQTLVVAPSGYAVVKKNECVDQSEVWMFTSVEDPFSRYVVGVVLVVAMWRWGLNFFRFGVILCRRAQKCWCHAGATRFECL